MFSALFSFLGGSAFRMLWGELSAYFTRQQEHAHEIERLRLQNDLEAAQHARQTESIKLQSEMGIKVIEAQREADIDHLETEAWADRVRAIGTPTGIKIIDAWNAGICPALATLSILVIMAEVVVAGFVISDWTRELIAAAIGLYVADRRLQKRGK